ncbi:hypothetical protein LINPERHAP1_LOCUS26262 [Linum perenne]
MAVLETHLGQCFLAFSSNLGKCFITRAKVKVVVTGLELAREAGYQHVLLQMDSVTAGMILTNEGDISHRHAREVLHFRELMDRGR